MSENIENNIENQEVSEQMEMDRRAKLQVWTTEKQRQIFKSFEGKTDQERLENILGIATKFKDRVDNFSIKNDIDSIERSFTSIKMKLQNIQDSVNMYEEDLVKSNMNQLIELKDSIIQEEILNARIIQIEKERDTFEERLKKEESMLISCQNRVKELEESNRSLTQKNSDLVHAESNNTKLLREKEVEINKINQENEKSLKELNSKHDDKLKAKEEEIKGIKDKLKNQEKQHEEEIVKLDKEKIKLTGTIDKYKELLEVSKTNLENSKLELEEIRTKHEADIENIRQKYIDEIRELRNTHKKELQEVRDSSKEELKELRTNNATERTELLEAHKNELKELQLQVQQASKEEAKSQSKVEILEDNIKVLKEQKGTLEGQLKALEDKLKTTKEDLELQEETTKQLLEEKDKEINKLKEDLKKANKNSIK